MAYNESQQPRFPQAVARLHDVKGNPTPQITPEIGHGITLDQVSFGYELEALTGRRNVFVGVTSPAIAATVPGVRLLPAQNTVLVITGVQVNKPTAGFVDVMFDDFTSGPFTGTFSGSVAFFRDTRWGNSQTARPGVSASTHLTGALPASTVIKRVAVLANQWTQIPLVPGFVMVAPSPGVPSAVSGAPSFGVFGETLNEALDVMIDCYERAASASELKLPQ